MKYFDLFSGIGGFHLGMSQAGHECVGACEIDKHARQVYGRHFTDTQIWEDATKLKPYELPDFDCLVAGFPCQAFSLAGKRMGFNDTRGTLFFEIVRIAKIKRPQLLLLENVKGLLYHKEGNTFRTILTTLDELGYDVEWQVLDGKYFIPQDRQRLFIIGHLRGSSFRPIFPFTEYSSTIKKPQKEKVRAVSVENTTANGRRIKNPGEPSFTLSTSGAIGIAFNDDVFRYFTILELERLQGFPDYWTDNLVATKRKRCLGNAVPPPMVRYIAEHLVL